MSPQHLVRSIPGLLRALPGLERIPNISTEFEVLGFNVQPLKVAVLEVKKEHWEKKKNLTVWMRRLMPGSKIGKTNWNFKAGCAKSSSSSQEVPGPHSKVFQSRWI